MTFPAPGHVHQVPQFGVMGLWLPQGNRGSGAPPEKPLYDERRIAVPVNSGKNSRISHRDKNIVEAFGNVKLK